MSEQDPQYSPPSPVYVTAAPAKKKKWPWVVGAVVVLMLIAAVSGGGGDKDKATASTPQPTATATVTETVTETGAAEPEPTEEPSEDVVVEEEDPYFNVGETIDLDSWKVRITNIDRDADREMAMANMFNDDPQGTYVLVTYDATYTGKKRIGDPSWDLTWSFSTPNGQVQDESYEVTPADNQEWPTEARHGGTIPMQVVFDIKGPIGGSIVTVEDDVNYADFKMAK